MVGQNPEKLLGKCKSLIREVIYAERKCILLIKGSMYMSRIYKGIKKRTSTLIALNHY